MTIRVWEHPTYPRMYLNTVAVDDAGYIRVPVGYIESMLERFGYIEDES